MASLNLPLHRRLRIEARVRRHLLKASRRSEGILFVYTMGKVGSSSVMASIRANGLDRRHLVLRSTFMSPAGVELIYGLHADGYGGESSVPEFRREHLYQSLTLGENLRSLWARGIRYKVISLVRDPIATNVAGFFQNDYWWPQDLQELARSNPDAALPLLYRRFKEHYPHQVPLTWFDMEMKASFGIDVYDKAFDMEKGYTIYSGDFADLLVIRLTDFNRSIVSAFHDFLGVERFEPMSDNVGSEKWYAGLYRQFRRTLPLHADYVDGMYDSKFARHFFTEDERTNYRKLWLREQDAAPLVREVTPDLSVQGS